MASESGALGAADVVRHAEGAREGGFRLTSEKSDFDVISPSRAEPSRAEGVLMRGAKAAAMALAWLAVAAVALTPTERASAQSVPNLFFSVDSNLVLESAGIDLLLFVTQATTADVHVSYTIGGTATCGTDYTIPGADCNAGTGTFIIPRGTPSFDSVAIPFSAPEDEVSDSGETVILTITDGADYDLGSPSVMTITIAENTGRSAFRISGQPQVNGTLTGNRVCTDADNEGSLSYQWQWSPHSSLDSDGSFRWRPLTGMGATSQSYTLQQSDSGNFIRLRVEYTDGKDVLERMYTPMVGPIGPISSNNTVKFSRNGYNVREGDPLRPTLTFNSPTSKEQAFTIVFHTCDAELPEDIQVDAYLAEQYGAIEAGATHSVTVPAGVTSHTFDVPVMFDSEIEGYESFIMGFYGLPSGITIGDQNNAQVQIVDVNLVPENWALKPSDVNVGEQFRLLFKTENERNGSSTNIGDYDTFVRNRISSSSTGHADIRQYAPTFRAVGSTNTVGAAWHTATGIMVNDRPSHTPFSHQINWLNGPKIANDYNDFWDGTWDNSAQIAANQRNANGVATTNNRGPNTGTQTGTTHATAGTKKANLYLGHSTSTRWGGAVMNQNPIDQGNIPVGNNNVYIGLSGIFMALDVTPANPLVTIKVDQEKVNEGTGIRYTLQAFPAPSSPITVNVKVTESGNFISPGEQLNRTVTIPTSGSATFTVRTVQDNIGELDGEVTVSIGAGTGYRTLAASDTVTTAINSEDEYNLISASVLLGNGTAGPAHTGAHVDFTFSLPEPREGRALEGIRVQLAYTPNVLSVESNDRPATWDRYAVNPEWKPDGSAKVSRHGVYVRPWLENEILPGDQSFSRRVIVKNRQEAGGAVGSGWIAMRVEPTSSIIPVPGADWACMPVGGGACPSVWPGVPTATVVALDNGSVMSGNDARFRVSVNPAPPAGETRRVYLKTWEVFIPPPRRGEKKVQHTEYTHVDVGSGGSVDLTMSTKIFRSKENMSGRNYWAEVQEDVAYSRGGSTRAKVVTSVFDPNAAACWHGHTHHSADSPYAVRIGPIELDDLKRLARQGFFNSMSKKELDADFNKDGTVNALDLARSVLPARYHYLLEVKRQPGMGITACLTEKEVEAWTAEGAVWTNCKADPHHTHPYSDSRGGSHSLSDHANGARKGNGFCAGPQSQLVGQDSQDSRADDPFPDPGALGFSDVTSSGMTLTWPEREVDGYLVYWAEAADGAESHEVEVDADTHSHTLTGLKAGTVYAAIVYSRGFDEVTTTGYQSTAAGPTTDTAPPPDYSELKATVRGYADETQHGQAHVDRWKRALAGLGDADALAEGYTPMTAAEAQDMADTYTASRWDPIVEALTELESREAEPEPDPIPELSLSGGSGVDEGGSASFTIHADPAPAADVAVGVAVAQSGDYLDAPGAGARTVTLAAGAATASVAIATVNDSTDEPDGSVSVSLNAGTGYTVASSSAAATVAVRDDDEPVPEVSVSAGGDVAEGAAASFTITASPAPASALDVDVTVDQNGDFAASGATGSRTVTIPSSGSATLTVATEDDGADEADGSVRVRIDAGAGYTVASSPNHAATVAVRDNDDPPPAASCVTDSDWDTVAGYYDSNANRSPNYGANWYRVLIAYRSERADRPLPDWEGATAAPTAAFTAADAEDEEAVWSGWAPVREVLECLEKPGTQSFVPLLPAASNPAREGVVRIANPGTRGGAVRIAATDDAGWRPEPILLRLGRGQSVLLTSADLESGNASKGLSAGIGTGTGDWRLTVSGDAAIQVQPHIRSADGRLAAMDAVAPVQDGAHQVAMLQPADDAQHTGLLRLVNRGSQALTVRITALDDSAAPGGAVSLKLPARAAATFTVSELERGGSSGLDGALGDGNGLWRLRVASTGELAVMALAEEPGGHLENLSDPAPAARLESGVHAVAGFPSAYGPAGRPGMLRIVNGSAAGGTVAIRPYDAEGRALSPVRLRLDAGEAVNLNAWDLEFGNPAKGLSGGAGPAPGDWRIEVESGLDLRVLPLIETRAANFARPADAQR